MIVNCYKIIYNICCSSFLFRFVLPGRFSQDCVENLFSVVRSKQLKPNALSVKNCFKLICVSQFSKCVKNSNYEEDDRTFPTDFLETLNAIKKRTVPADEAEVSFANFDISDIPLHSSNLNNPEQNVLYGQAGYIVAKIKHNNKVCEECIGHLTKSKPGNKKFEALSLLKYKTNPNRVLVTTKCFLFFVKLELIFRHFRGKMQNINLKNSLIVLAKKIETDLFKPCLKCDLRSRIIHNFSLYRLRISGLKKNRATQKNYSSRSMHL